MVAPPLFVDVFGVAALQVLVTLAGLFIARGYSLACSSCCLMTLFLSAMMLSRLSAS